MKKKILSSTPDTIPVTIMCQLRVWEQDHETVDDGKNTPSTMAILSKSSQVSSGELNILLCWHD